ncbi:MAG: hypothetical protein JO314_05500, partial [Acidobacteria bacterium]|nr:hypothetical protein [Acidobacteriota bacterium]
MSEDNAKNTPVTLADKPDQPVENNSVVSPWIALGALLVLSLGTLLIYGWDIAGTGIILVELFVAIAAIAVGLLI